MKLQIENTDRVVQINGVSSRIWEGKTEGGIPVVVFVAMVAVHKDHDQSAFERELVEAHPRPATEGRVFDSRMVL